MIEEHLLNNGTKRFRLILKGGHEIVSQAQGKNGVRETGEMPLLDEWAAAKEADGTVVELLQEGAYPAAILLQQLEGAGLPVELKERDFDDEWFSNQFGSKLFEQPADVFVFSLLPDISAEVWKRRGGDYRLTLPGDWQQQWTAEQRDWFLAHFESCGLSSVEQFKDDFGRVVERIQRDSEAQVVVLGVSSYDPVDSSHNYHSVEDTSSLRVHRFNHALIQLSQDMGLAILDVDRLIAEIGTKEHVRRLFSYSPEGNKIVCQELFRIVEDMGYFDNHPLLKVVMPQIDRMFQTGSIVKWHKREGKWVNEGDDLFDLKVEEFTRIKRSNITNSAEIESEETTSDKWSWVVRVTAADKGFFRKKLVSERERCSVGDLLAIFSVRDSERVNYNDLSIDDAPTLRVIANILETSE